jgi:ribonuclease P protein component
MKNRNCTSSDYNDVLNSKKRFESKTFIIYFKKSNFSATGIIVSKKVSKLAVERNKVKRQLRQIIMSSIEKIENLKAKIVVIAKPSFLNTDYSTNKENFLGTMKKISREVSQVELSV